MLATLNTNTTVVSLLLAAGAKMDLQNRVWTKVVYTPNNDLCINYVHFYIIVLHKPFPRYSSKIQEQGICNEPEPFMNSLDSEYIIGMASRMGEFRTYSQRL